eukprot:scaffold95713_cov15-Tisochrysis_lutea.AAC.1
MESEWVHGGLVVRLPGMLERCSNALEFGVLSGRRHLHAHTFFAAHAVCRRLSTIFSSLGFRPLVSFVFGAMPAGGESV